VISADKLGLVRDYVARGFTTFLFDGKGRFLYFPSRSLSLGGRCLACGGVMDQSGCRVSGQWADVAPGIPWAVEIRCDRAKVHE